MYSNTQLSCPPPRQTAGLAVVAVVVSSIILLPGVAAQTADLHAELIALLDTVHTATWVQTSWERLDDREEHTSARCIWAGQDNMRLDVFDGRGAGSTAILVDGRVYGFRRGLLSVFKRSFEPTHPRVLSLRGNSMMSNGFLDDFRYVLASWDSVSIDVSNEFGDRLRMSYPDAEGLDATLHMSLDPLRVMRHERRERGRVVESYTYSDVHYNPPIDPSQLRP